MTRQELIIKQALPLELKVEKFEKDIVIFERETGGLFYAAYSGGQDSSVGLDLIQKCVDKGLIKQPRIVFSNTGQEYKGIVENVHSSAKKYNINIQIVKPKIYKKLQQKGLYPTDLWKEVGFPVATKQVSMAISRYRSAREKVRKILKKAREKEMNEQEKKKLIFLREVMRTRLFGTKYKNGVRGTSGTIPKKWRHFINKPYKISEKCCDHLKKEPMKTFARENNMLGYITFTKAGESKARQEKVLKEGCVVIDHDNERYLARLLSIWTDKDIKEYIKINNLKLPKEYTEMGMQRTGCRSCPFGCHLESKENMNRYQINHTFYPKEHEHDMKYMGMGKIVEDMGVSYNKDDFKEIEKQKKLF